jgi:hypothetical protein
VSCKELERFWMKGEGKGREEMASGRFAQDERERKKLPPR